MKQKIILGILSSDPYNEKESFLDQLANHGFSIHSISSKIEEIAKYLLKVKDISEVTQEDIYSIRKKGYSINSLYWVNLLLTSIPEKENKILIYDLWKDDLFEWYVTPVLSDPILAPNIDFVRFPSALTDNEIKQWKKEVEQKLYNDK